jgi:hypothetical protein
MIASWAPAASGPAELDGIDLDPSHPPRAAKSAGPAACMIIATVALAPALVFAQPGAIASSGLPVPLAGFGVAVALVAGFVAARLLSLRREKACRPADAAARAGMPEIEQLRDLLELSSDWHWETDEQHRYTHVSDGLWSQSRMDPTAFVGRAPWDLDWDAGDPNVWDRYRDRVRDRVPIRLILSRVDASGARRHLELIGRPCLPNGIFTGYHGVGNDVTERVEAERALQESQIRYREVVDSVNEIIFRTDARGRLSFLNHAWEVITAHSVSDSLGKPLVDFLHPDDRVAAWHEMARVSRGEVPDYLGQLRLRTRHGEVRWIEAAARRVRAVGEDAGISGLAGTLDDISARKVAEMTLRNINQELEARVSLRTAELETSNRELEAFSYSVSHDLRAPLRAIDGFARILEEELADRLDPESRSHITRIRKASLRMAHLIDDLIELARLTRQALHKETIDLSEIAIQIIDELRSEEPARKVEVQVTSDLIVTADRTLMRVALENLLRNAWKFSSRREHAYIAFSAERDQDRRVFCISDNGEGFDMAFAANLFRPFHRLHGTADFPGSGIGLANVQRILARHGGKIWAESSPGKGASFFFTLGT